MALGDTGPLRHILQRQPQFLPASGDKWADMGDDLVCVHVGISVDRAMVVHYNFFVNRKRADCKRKKEGCLT